MTKTTTDDAPTAEQIEAEAQAAHREDLRSEHEAWKQRMGKVAPAVDLGSPYLQHRTGRRGDGGLIGYPLGRNRNLTPRDKPTLTARRPTELPTPLDRRGVAPVLDRLAQLDINAPKGAPEAFARAADCRHRAKPESEAIFEQMRQQRQFTRHIHGEGDWVTLRNDDVAGERDAIAARLSRGEINPDQARQLLAQVGNDTAEQARDAVWNRLRKDALDHYVEAWQAFRAEGDRIMADLHTIAVECVDAQTKSAEPLADQAARWELAHDTAEHLRTFAVANLDAAPLDWRYGRPDLPWAEWVQRSGRAVSYDARDIPGTSERLVLHTGTQPPGLPEGGPYAVSSNDLAQLRSRHPSPLTLTAAAQHPEWKPGCYTAEQVWETLTTIATEQGQW